MWVWVCVYVCVCLRDRYKKRANGQKNQHLFDRNRVPVLIFLHLSALPSTPDLAGHLSTSATLCGLVSSA